ncbi:hypothetical protein QBC40DRAFT_220080 [Triangularia verruculosa]|uniref:Uncharacterized protein n=1 Tax=Triangularia verruculosa TaxID=2587418 RepID=A0AAN7AYE4_9PEZI|nr:hypothetical protein QBC40DRAFT_220080 [Triangularia verruculosa]
MELSKSRHAPWNRRHHAAPSSNYSRPALLTVNPAPITPLSPTTIYLSDNTTTHLHPPPQPPPPTSPLSSPTTTPHQPTALKSALELSRYRKILRRLQWKSQFLDSGYQLAIHRLNQDPLDVAERELMFKLDFFEYYMLIERAIVHLLAVFHIDIPSSSSTRDPSSPVKQPQQPLGGGLLPNSRWKKQPITHRYHANVLSALDSPHNNPLHSILGQGEVRKQLQRAKDLRNRWKTAGEENQDDDDHHKDDSREWQSPKKIAAPLETYDLRNMLRAISDGFCRAGEMAEGYVLGLGERDGDDDWGRAEAAIREEEGRWDFMVDAMDWEAV